MDISRTRLRHRAIHAPCSVLLVPSLELIFLPIGKMRQRKKGLIYVILLTSTLIYITQFSWLYSLFLALDGNFRMTRRGVSSDERDPCLTQNRGYFVDRAELAAHLEAHKGQPQEVSKHYSLFMHYDFMIANRDMTAEYMRIPQCREYRRYEGYTWICRVRSGNGWLCLPQHETAQQYWWLAIGRKVGY